LTFNTTVANICFNSDIVVGVRDKCQAEDINTGTIHFCVKNNPPAFTDKAAATNAIDWGQTFTFDFNATDPDPGPYQFFHVISGPGTIDAGTGVYTWNTGLVDPFGGSFPVTVKVDDGAITCDPCSPSNSAEYTFTINVYLLQVQISKEEDVFLGQQRDVTIDVSDISFFNTPIGGFDFLVQYDASSMMFMKADPGSFLTGCEWEYFTYRFGANGNCGAGACPSGILRVVAMGETTGGNLAHSPTCWIADAGDQLVVLHFLMSADANLECQFAAIRFIWYDCADNGISSQYGDTLYISKYVWDFGGFDGSGDPIFNEITGLDQTFPTLTGVPNTAECNVSRKGEPWRLIHFNNGGMDIICADTIDAVGDINMNNIGYEIADAVMFTNYFLTGISAFGTHPEGSIAASDTNKDGITLSVADLVYLIRVIVGDALPYNKVGATTVSWKLSGDVISVDSELGGLVLTVQGQVDPTLLDSRMAMTVGFDGQNTRVVVTAVPVEGNTNISFTGNILAGISGDVVNIDMATPDGQMVTAKNVPAAYSLSQNYPNPFNPSTKVNVALKDAGDYSLTIYNVQGQVVQVISGTTTGPEFIEITWDASNLASGVYFYKLTAGNFTDTKKAVFLK